MFVSSLSGKAASARGSIYSATKFGLRGFALGLREDLRDTGGISATDRAALAVALDFGLAMQHLLDPDRVPAELYAHGMRLVLGKAVA